SFTPAANGEVVTLNTCRAKNFLEPIGPFFIGTYNTVKVTYISRIGIIWIYIIQGLIHGICPHRCDIIRKDWISAVSILWTTWSNIRIGVTLSHTIEFCYFLST